jgi:hypothetical protein
VRKEPKNMQRTSLSPTNDRRLIPRLRLERMACVESPAKPQRAHASSQIGCTVDLSASGCLLRCPRSLKVGADVLVSLRLGDAVLRLVGIVRRRSRVEALRVTRVSDAAHVVNGGQWELAIEFRDDEASEAALDSLWVYLGTPAHVR